MIYVSLPFATFGLLHDGVVITDAPPIARWCVGRLVSDVWRYWLGRGAHVEAMP